MFHFVVVAAARRRNPIINFLFTTENPSLYERPHLLLLRSLHHKPITKKEEPIKKNNHSSSLTASNSCGLSPQSALSSSREVPIKSTENHESVLNFFKSYGFTMTQIEMIITKYPQFLSFNLEKTIKPKLDYFLDFGFSVTELAHLVSFDPVLLTVSLEKRLKPNFELLNSVIGNTQQIAAAARRSSWLLLTNLKTYFLPNVRILQSYGVPDPNIAKLVTFHPRAALQATDQFAAIVSSIKKYGFNPSSTIFVSAVKVMSGLNPSSWEKKVAVYNSLGWSEGDIISAFTKHPHCMALSEEKIRRGMDFFVNKMHWEPSFLSERPVLLSLSLEKRVIPRCSVMSLLASKGLVTKKSFVHSLFIIEKDFLNKYVINYKDQVPEVLQAYRVNLKFVGIDKKSAIVKAS